MILSFLSVFLFLPFHILSSSLYNFSFSTSFPSIYFLSLYIFSFPLFISFLPSFFLIHPFICKEINARTVRRDMPELPRTMFVFLDPFFFFAYFSPFAFGFSVSSISLFAFKHLSTFENFKFGELVKSVTVYFFSEMK